MEIILEWQGAFSVGGLVDNLVKDAALKNPGPMKNISFRIPLSAEARLLVLADVLKVPKTTLLRDVVMAALLEAENRIFDELLTDNEARQRYDDEYERYFAMLSDGAKPDPLGIEARVAEIRKTGQGGA